MCKIVLTKKFENKLLNDTDTKKALLSKGINDINEFNDLLIKEINKKININEVVYKDINIDTYVGFIVDSSDKKLSYIFVIPPKLGTRSGFLTQQSFGFLSNVILENIDATSSIISNLPVLIINSDVEDVNLSKAINIIGSKILGFIFIDLYNRDYKNILLKDKGTQEFNSMGKFNTLVGVPNDYFDINESTKTIKFKTDSLKSLKQSLTNEPYYFAIKAYPALYLASIEGYEIDISLFDKWYANPQRITNKNIEAFYLFTKKIISNNKITKQIIYYGAPGTGKSFKIDNILKNTNSNYIYRITFHPEYSYTDFTGQLLPTVEKDQKGNSIISYKFNKGVFTQALKKAYEDLSKDVYLILEEMSRGDVAAILGDIFQLLDREHHGVYKGFSKYFISNDIIAKDIIAITGNKIKLPPNFHVLGTVNTSDQNVFAMDTAFKRRFEWEYINTLPVKDSSNKFLNNPTIKLIKPDGSEIEINWVDFYQGLNKFISHKDYLELGEDKQIGQFFIEFNNDSDEIVNKKIHNKLLQYLWNDVQKASYKTNKNLFSDNISSFSELYTLFEQNKNIFSNDLFECIEDDE